MEKILTQALVIENPGPYTVTVLTDRDNDNLVERHTIEAGADGTLRHRTWETDSTRTNTNLVFDVTWSENNRNQDEGVPLVYYFDDSQTRILDMATVPDQAVYINMQIVVEYDEKLYSDERSALLRNR
jgi:hypothetical protein